MNCLYVYLSIFPTEPELILYPPVLTVFSSDPPDTTASLTCTSDNTNVPVLFSGAYTSLGITSTYLDDTNSSVRLDFELNESIIGMLDGMEFICEARDPDDLNSTVSIASSTFRKVSGNYIEANSSCMPLCKGIEINCSNFKLLRLIIILIIIAAPLTLFAIEPSSRKQAMDGAMINTASSFECLWYINPTRMDLEPIAETLFWRINHLETKEEIEFTSDVSGEDFIVSTLENSITLNILGNFLGSVSCIYGKDSININVVTNGKNVYTYNVPCSVNKASRIIELVIPPFL